MFSFVCHHALLEYRMKVCGIDWYQSWNESLKSHTRTTCAQFCNYALSCSPSASSTVISYHILSHLSHNRRKQTVYCPRLLDYVFNDEKEPWTWYAIHPPPLSSSWSTIVTLYCSWYTTIFFSSWAHYPWSSGPSPAVNSWIIWEKPTWCGWFMRTETSC